MKVGVSTGSAAGVIEAASASAVRHQSVLRCLHSTSCATGLPTRNLESLAGFDAIEQFAEDGTSDCSRLIRALGRVDSYLIHSIVAAIVTTAR
ncbi:hypothetical protein CPT32_24800 [Rhizobium sophoriradicis]|nr:hypothetical protein CPT32_24800 [Rhizobium sophoriradicis]